jgi:ubiquitin-protein ligase
MDVREDRLWAEYNAMKKFRSQVVTWETVGGNNPPDVYHFTYNLKSIVGFDSNGKPRFHTGFKVEVKFPRDYPRSKPDVRLVSKLWPYHPNIWARDGRFCLEGTQHWIPGIGVSLDSICQMIGEIIAFQEVNLNSPANGDQTLRKWIRNELHFFKDAPTKVMDPVDPSPIRLPDIEDAIRWGDDEAPAPEPRIRFG